MIILILALGLLSWGQAQTVLPEVAPVTLSAGWSAVMLPDSPATVTAAPDGTLWVAGANEMIAESNDGI